VHELRGFFQSVCFKSDVSYPEWGPKILVAHLDHRLRITAARAIVGSRGVFWSGDVISAALASLRDPQMEFGGKRSIAQRAFDPAFGKGVRHQEPRNGYYGQH